MKKILITKSLKKILSIQEPVVKQKESMEIPMFIQVIKILMRRLKVLILTIQKQPTLPIDIKKVPNFMVMEKIILITQSIKNISKLKMMQTLKLTEMEKPQQQLEKKMFTVLQKVIIFPNLLLI